MTIERKCELVKNLKTAAKFTRIARTMIDNVVNEVKDEKPDSIVIQSLESQIIALSIECDKFNKEIEEFKSEHKVPGYQLTIFDVT